MRGAFAAISHGTADGNIDVYAEIEAAVIFIFQMLAGSTISTMPY